MAEWLQHLAFSQKYKLSCCASDACFQDR